MQPLVIDQSYLLALQNDGMHYWPKAKMHFWKAIISLHNKQVSGCTTSMGDQVSYLSQETGDAFQEKNLVWTDLRKGSDKVHKQRKAAIWVEDCTIWQNSVDTIEELR